MSPYRERYRKELNDLKDLTKDLAEQVNAAINKSVTALMRFECGSGQRGHQRRSERG